MDRKHYEPEHIAFGEAVRAFIDKEMVPNFLEWEQIGSAPAGAVPGGRPERLPRHGCA